MEINEINLLKSGYKRFEIPYNSAYYKYADRFYQKELSDTPTKFINVYYYDKFKENGALDYDYEFECVEETENFWEKTIIYALNKELTIEEIEKELEK